MVIKLFIIKGLLVLNVTKHFCGFVLWKNKRLFIFVEIITITEENYYLKDLVF